MCCFGEVSVIARNEGSRDMKKIVKVFTIVKGGLPCIVASRNRWMNSKEQRRASK